MCPMLKNSFVIIIIIFVSAVLAAELPQDYKFRRSINATGDGKFAEFELDGKVYENSDLNFSDLRIFNAEGKEIPFYLKSGEASEISENVIFQTWKMEEKYDPKTDASILGFQIMEEKDVFINKLKFSFKDEEFSKQIEISGRDDNSEWNYIKSDTVYKIKNLIKEEIYLESTYNYKFYKIEFTGRPSDFSNDEIEASYDSSVIVKSDFIKTVKTEFDYSQKENISEIKIANEEKMFIKKIKINSNGFFNRNYDVLKDDENFIQSGLLYRATFNDVKMEQTEINFESPQNTNLIINIENKNDSPIIINSIELSVINYKIIFNYNPQEKYFLYYGKDDATAPQYDITDFKEHIEKENRLVGTLGDIEKLKVKSDKFSVIFRYIFNGMIVIVSLVMIVIISMKLKPVKEKIE